MKINKTDGLSRYNFTKIEVKQWLDDTDKQYAEEGRTKELPPNYAYAREQVRKYLERPNSVVRSDWKNAKMRVSPEFYKLMRTLKCEPYKLEKNELMMVYEHRPDTREFLETIIEECEERFAGKEHLLDEILGHIKETLGPCATKEEGDAFKAKQDALDDEEEAQPSEAERELRKEVEREDAAEVRQAEIDWALRPTVIRKQDLPNKIKLNPEFDDDPEAPIHMCLNDLTLEEKIEAAIWIDGTPFKGLPYVPNPPKETQREVLPWTARQAMTGGEHLEPIPALPEHISRANYKKDMKKKGNK